MPLPCVCVATLGSQPQIVTLALDALLIRGYPLTELIVIHLTQHGPHYQAALQRLAALFVDDHYCGQPLRFRMLPILIGQRPVADVQSEAAVDAASTAIQRLLQQLKAQHATIHLCATGGRRVLSMLATAAALQHFDQHDRVWHLYSSDAVRAATHRGAQMHYPDAAEVALLRIPVPTLGAGFGALPAAPAVVGTPPPEYERCREVLTRISPRQCEVLQAVARGLSPQEVAAALSVEVSTVYSHQKVIFQECINVWGLPPEQRANARWLREHFAPFFADQAS